MPTKLKYQRQRIKLNLDEMNMQNSQTANNMVTSIHQTTNELLLNSENKPKSILIKNSLSHSNIENLMIGQSGNSATQHQPPTNSIDAVIDTLNNCIKDTIPAVNSAVANNHDTTTSSLKNPNLTTSLSNVNSFNSKLQDIENEQHHQQIFNTQLKEEIERLNQELNNYKETINTMRKNENKLIEK